jgi:TolA-binding protein
MVDIEVKTTRKEALEQQRIMKEKTEDNMREFQAQLEEVKTTAQRGSTPAVGASTVQPPTFNGNTTWSVFRRRFEIVAEHNRWSVREKSTYLITAIKGRAADVLYGIPPSTTYEETLQALEDRFGGQHFSEAYRCQLTSRIQEAEESLQDFATAIEQLAHRAYPTLPEGHIRRVQCNVYC